MGRIESIKKAMQRNYTHARIRARPCYPADLCTFQFQLHVCAHSLSFENGLSEVRINASHKKGRELNGKRIEKSRAQAYSSIFLDFTIFLDYEIFIVFWQFIRCCSPYFDRFAFAYLVTKEGSCKGSTYTRTDSICDTGHSAGARYPHMDWRPMRPKPLP